MREEVKKFTRLYPCPSKAHNIGIVSSLNHNEQSHFIESKWQHDVEIQRLALSLELREARGGPGLEVSEGF